MKKKSSYEVEVITTPFLYLSMALPGLYVYVHTVYPVAKSHHSPNVKVRDIVGFNISLFCAAGQNGDNYAWNLSCPRHYKWRHLVAA